MFGLTLALRLEFIYKIKKWINSNLVKHNNCYLLFVDLGLSNPQSKL